MDIEPKYLWIGGGIIALAGIVLGMSAINVGSAIAKCEQAGYGQPERALTVTACPADEDYAHDSVAMVVGNVASSPAPTITDESKKYLLNSLAYTDNKLELYAYSATPSGQRIDIKTKKTKTSSNLGTFIRNSTNKIEAVNEAIQQKPIEGGVDYFNNIVAAGKAVTSSPKVDSPLILVTGSGLSTAQPLNFADSDLLHSDPAEVIQELKASSTINGGELTGVKVVWSGLGVTAPPQKPLDAKEKRNLEKIYTLVLNYMGAKLITDDTVMASDSVNTEMPVPAVKVNGISGGVVVYKLGENSIGFKPDTADIVDVAKANSSIEGIVSDFKGCRNTKITIEGYTARVNGKAEDTSALSTSRAEAVKKLLAGHGVDESAMTAVGRGSSDFDGRVSENDAEGKWSSERAQANRVVLVKMQSGGECRG